MQRGAEKKRLVPTVPQPSKEWGFTTYKFPLPPDHPGCPPFKASRAALGFVFFNYVTSLWYHLQADVSGEGFEVKRGLMLSLGCPHRGDQEPCLGIRASLFRRLESQLGCQFAQFASVTSAKFPPRSGLYLLCCEKDMFPVSR